jgi:hypothetical protein
MSSSGMLRCAVRAIATRHNIQEDAILHSHRREYLKSYITKAMILSNMSVY